MHDIGLLRQVFGQTLTELGGSSSVWLDCIDCAAPQWLIPRCDAGLLLVIDNLGR